MTVNKIVQYYTYDVEMIMTCCILFAVLIILTFIIPKACAGFTAGMAIGFWLAACLVFVYFIKMDFGYKEFNEYYIHFDSIVDYDALENTYDVVSKNGDEYVVRDKGFGTATGYREK